MQTFTFPSRQTVELPQGMAVCQAPAAVTYDCARLIPVGHTRAGRPVISSFSCAAYARASAVYDLRRVVGERARALRVAAGEGRRTGHLVEALAHHRQVLAQTLTAYASDPAPCTCPA